MKTPSGSGGFPKLSGDMIDRAIEDGGPTDIFVAPLADTTSDVASLKTAFDRFATIKARSQRRRPNFRVVFHSWLRLRSEIEAPAINPDVLNELEAACQNGFSRMLTAALT